MFDEDARKPRPPTTPEEEYLQQRATDELIDRDLARAGREILRAFSMSLAAGARRDLGQAEARAAVGAIEPHLGLALRIALRGDGDPDESLSLAEVAGMIGIPRHSLTRHVRQGDSPISFVRDGHRARFRRGDVEQFLAGERADASPADGSIVRLLVESIRRALPAARNGRPLLKTPEAAKMLGVTPKALWGACRRGTSPVKPVRIGARLFFFRRSEIEAAVAAKIDPPTSQPKEH